LVAGSIAALVKWRKRCLAPLFLFWMPLPFYAYSVAWGSVPIFIPLWWPHSWYNTRYGMEMLPIFGSLPGLSRRMADGSDGKALAARAQLILLAAMVLILVDCSLLMRSTPLVLR
jgi:hypothetical protein